MQNSEKREMKKNVKRAAWFIGVYFVFALFFSALLQVAGIKSPVLNGFIIVVTACVFYLIFWLICSKIDKKKALKDAETEKGSDPFAD